MKCQLLMTGNELMTGITIDSNSAFIAEQLQLIGIAVTKIVTVGDSLATLETEIREAAIPSDLLIINGGLGPTDDDLTALALANVCHKPLMKNVEAEKHVMQWCLQRGVTANQANLKQALLPQESLAISNSAGSAVGIYMQQNRCLILCTPGVPHEMRAMMQNEIIPLLKEKFPDCQQQFIKRFQVFGIGESSIQNKIHDQFPDWPREIELGFRAGIPALEVKLTARLKKHILLRDEYEQHLRGLLGSQLFGEENDTLQSVVVKSLKYRNQKLVTAESCTGGLIASMITSIPGASQVFEAGFVTYSNDIKHRVLQVNQLTLQTVGAVSKEVVLQMAQGALEKSGADYVIAVSGIAGPDGGTPDKPIGTAYIAWGSMNAIKVHHFFYPAERKTFQLLIAAYALDLIRREILQIPELPRYLK